VCRGRSHRLIIEESLHQQASNRHRDLRDPGPAFPSPASIPPWLSSKVRLRVVTRDNGKQGLSSFRLPDRGRSAPRSDRHACAGRCR
jgi:hypothetical protein